MHEQDHPGNEYDALPGADTTNFQAKINAPRPPLAQETDFQTLKQYFPGDERRVFHRSATDVIIDALTPVMIFVMVYAVIFFLLDVRYVYTEVHDKNMRWTAFFFIMGIVALNRVIAREGSEESFAYAAALMGVVAFYTVFTTSVYTVGSFARNFLDQPWIAALFNMTVVAFIWWLTNRLMHECSIDENMEAGDVGILTGTLRDFRNSSSEKAAEAPQPKAKKKSKEVQIDVMEIEAFDPTTWVPPEEKAAEPKKALAANKRMSGRHPGISIFYFSLPVMLIFTVGYPVLMQGGDLMILAGHFYVGIYTIAALSLLMLTSLGGLREYFRSRNINFPAGIGWFWLGLGLVMMATVLIGATQLPKTGLPEMAYIDEHEVDFWTRDSTFELQSSGATAARIVEQTQLLDRIGRGVLVCLGLFLAFGALRSAGGVAAYVERHRLRFSPRVVRFFEKLDRLILKYVRVPRLPKRKRRIRLDPAVATCAEYQSPLHGEGVGSGADVVGFVAHSYDALCALANDLGVPRQSTQTPYEFVEAFPEELEGIKDEALELTEMYVRSVYSDQPPNEEYLERLRRFWLSYNRLRDRYVR